VPNATVNGATIHYETAGEGFPLVLLHGIGSNSRSWRRQLTSLSSDFRVVAWDAPGYGLSSDPPPTLPKPSMSFYADCLRGLLDSLNLKEIFLLGHSTGGVIAQEFYRTNPDYVRALILADTRCVGSPGALGERLKWIHSMTPEQLAVERAPKLLSSRASAGLIHEVTSIMSQVRPAGYEFAAIALAESDTREVLRNLRVPTLLIWGSDDDITPIWPIQDARAPGARLEVIPEAGHLCYIEQPDRFNTIVREFLREDHSS
jgi:pimeloyl-ACP methyl ester carboxylesterase